MKETLGEAAVLIGLQVRALMEQIAGIDEFQPGEDQIEVLIGSFKTWGTIEAQVLFPALETYYDESAETIAAARERLNTLQKLEDGLHLDTGAEGPFSHLAAEYMNAVKYHLAADIQDFVPLAQALPEADSRNLAKEMAAMRLDLE